MKYMALIYTPPSPTPEPEPGSPEFDAYMEPWIKADTAFREAGVFVAGEALLPTEMATTVRVRSGQTETMDGPFAETKERLGGYYIFDCQDLDEAIRFAAMIPVHEFGSVELRPVMDLPDFA